MTMFTVKNIPDNLYKKLKKAAKVNRRSINNEIIVCIEKAVQSRAADLELIIQRARKLRTFTQSCSITEDELTQAKTFGRPCMIVVDTYIIAYLFLEGLGSQSANAEQLLMKDADWAAPVLWRREFRSILVQYIRTDRLILARCQTIMQEAISLMYGREYEVPSFEVLRLVAASACSAYGCEFVALAKDLDVPLITADHKTLRNLRNAPNLLRTIFEKFLTPHPSWNMAAYQDNEL